MNTTRMYTGDLKPDLEVTLSDPDAPVDVTPAAVRVIGKLDGQIVFDRAPSDVQVVDDTSVVTMEWAEGDTAAAGYLGIEIEVAWPTAKPQTFRAGAVNIIEDYDLDAEAAPARPPAQTRAKITRALARFYDALASVADTPVDIMVGPTDSIGDGLAATSFTKKFSAVLRDRLRNAFQPDGIAGGTGYTDFWNQGAFPDHPVVLTNPVVNQQYGLGLQSLVMYQLTENIVITDTFTSADLAIRTAPGAGFVFYTVDGGAPVAVDADAPAGEATLTIGPLAAGEHEIVLYGGITPDPVTYEGVMLYNGDEAAGIRVWEAGQSGYRAEQYVASPTWAEAVERVQPALVVLPIGSNDYAIGRTAAETRDDIETIIALIRANTSVAPSIVLLAYYDREHLGTETWADFQNMYGSIAAADDDVAWLDMTDDFGPWTEDDRGGLTDPGDLTHPTDAGHFLIGSALYEFVTP